MWSLHTVPAVHSQSANKLIGRESSNRQPASLAKISDFESRIVCDCPGIWCPNHGSVVRFNWYYWHLSVLIWWMSVSIILCECVCRKESQSLLVLSIAIIIVHMLHVRHERFCLIPAFCGKRISKTVIRGQFFVLLKTANSSCSAKWCCICQIVVNGH